MKTYIKISKKNVTAKELEDLLKLLKEQGIEEYVVFEKQDE